MNIGDLLFMLGVDGSRLEQDATAEAQKAGDAAGKTLSQRMAAGLKANGVKVLAGAFSAAAAVATKGALQMEDAVARIRSETGLAQDQAEAVARASNRIAGDQQQSLEAVTDVAIAIKKNLGATGEELDRLTEQTVKFARATKQDGVGAVMAMDDIVDAWGLSLADVQKVQDQLLVSNQKFGGSIEDNEKALSMLAPQLKALGASVDDGIALLNLFAASGLDSSKALAALNTAVKKLKPGQTLDDLIKQVSAIEDPTQRAQKAIELFGAKGGVALANVLKPGINSLDDFGVSAQDAAGAVDKSVDDLDSSLGGRLRKIVSQAKAAIRGFGADFGPALTGAASLASLAGALGLKLPTGPFKALGGKIAGLIGAGIVGNAGSGIIADSIADGVEGSIKSGRLSGASKKVGDFLGTGMGKAFSVAFAAVAVVELVKTFDEIKGQLDAQARDITASTAGWAKTATKEQLAAQLEAVKEARQQIINLTTGGGGIFTPVLALFRSGQLDELDKQQRELEAALANAGEDIQDSWDRQMTAVGATTGPSFADGVESTIGAVSTAAKAVADGAAKALDAAPAAARSAGGQTGIAFADGLRSNRQVALDAIDNLTEAIKNALTPSKQAARLTGFLVGKELQKGLHSADPAVRHQAEGTRALVEERLAKIIAGSGKAAKAAGQALANGLRSKNPEVRAQAQRIQELVNAKLAATAGKAGKEGTQTGNAFVNNLKNAIRAGDFKVQFSLGVAIGARAVGGPVVAGMPYLVNERTPHSEVMVPSTSGRILTEAQAIRGLADAMGAGSGATTYNIPVHVTGVLAARKPEDLARPLRQLAAAGVLTTPAERTRVKVPTRG